MEAWVTLATNDEYAVGALTVAASLKRVQTSKKLVVMVTSKMISERVLQTLREVFDEVVSVEEMDSGDIANLTLLDRIELGITFTKVRILNRSKLCSINVDKVLDIDTVCEVCISGCRHACFVELRRII